MKGQQIRLIIIVVIGIVALFAAKPIMTQVMLYQENQKAKLVTPPPDYVPPINPGGASVGGGPGDSDDEDTAKTEKKSDSEESKSEVKPASEGSAEGK